MRALVLGLLAASAFAQPRIDNVLVRMVPPGATSLVGVRMNEIRDTAFYLEILQQGKLPQLDQFARDTNFDPRRDVRELLFASTKTGGVLLARGSFKLSVKLDQALHNGQKPLRHGVYNVWANANNGFCILDGTLAVAGDIPSIYTALDEWTSGRHVAAQPLLLHAKSIDGAHPVWGVSTGFAGFLADNMPKGAGGSSGIDFAKIFRGLEDTWFEASFTKGFQGQVHGATSTEQDARNLRDAAKGLIGFGRLSVPENQPELLRLWDGFEVRQENRTLEIMVDIPQDLVSRLIQILTAPGRGGRGRGRA